MPGDQIRDYPNVAVFFRVTIDAEQGSLGIPLGNFSGCDGLSIDVQTIEREEGGSNDFVWTFPVRLKYANVKLTRPIGPESTKIAAWFAGLASSGWKRTTARIAALTTEGKELVAWNLGGVLPVKWQGPSFSAESPKVATETLELSHQGFLMEAGQ
jgi:phage tail-like protein